MAENEKCFCHLNGYKVKDADARAAIAEQQKKIETNTVEIGVNTQRIDDLDHHTNDLDGTIEEHSTQINGIVTDVQKNTAQISALQTELEETDEALRAYVDEKIGSALEGSY